MQARLADGEKTSFQGTAILQNAWLKLERVGKSFIGYYSTDGATWDVIHKISIDMNEEVYVGLAVSNFNQSSLCTAVFSQVDVNNPSPFDLPAPWENADIGVPQLTGKASYQGGVFSIDAGGSDIWGTSDKFHYVYQALRGDGEIVAKVESMDNTNSWAKAGVMIRSSLSANASHGMVIRTPGGTTAFQRRVTTGSSSTSTHDILPGNQWIKLSRVGNTLSAYTSADGKSWQLIDTENIVMSNEVFVGLAVTSHNSAATCNTEISNVTVEEGNGTNPTEFKIFEMSRLSGDVDLSGIQNTVDVTTSAAHANEMHIYTGLRGKTISVDLVNQLSSQSGTISLKVMPDNLSQTSDVFQSDAITIRQAGNKITVTVNGTQLASDIKLDKRTCNHVVLRFVDGTTELYVNGNWEAAKSNPAFAISEFDLGEYNGQVWDIQLFNYSLSNDKVSEMGQFCLTNMPVDNPPSADLPNPVCGPYLCIWVPADKDASELQYKKARMQFERTYENAVLNTGMYLTGELDAYLESRKKRDVLASPGFDDRWIQSYTFPLTRTTSNYWVHENFHSYQGFEIDRKGKWLAEATAEWAPDAVYPGATSTLLGYYTFFPHMSVYRTINSEVGDVPGQEFKGGSNYGSYVLFS
ncbi:MAG: DUF1349 domain-containing protein, partial [Bacteroidales bacterium]|nr:DUF1349 domain-containing protein [Bacteroidales bacterium]